MPMRPFNMRLPDDLKELAQREASAQGLDLSEYIRTAILLRAALDAAIRVAKSCGTEVEYEELLLEIARGDRP